MNRRFFLFYAAAFLSYIVINTPLHVWPIEPLSDKVEYPLCTYMSHIVMEVLQDNRLILLWQY